MMFFYLIFLSVFLHVHHVSSIDGMCVETPVFTPSTLVVMYNDPAAATCIVCQHKCSSVSHSGLEVPIGDPVNNGTMWTWTVDRVSEWDMLFKCYYERHDEVMCTSAIIVTVYQPPKNVSISFVNQSEPVLECEQYTLQCTVQDVAPVEKLIVTFYRGNTALGQQQSHLKLKKPVTEVFNLTINTTEKDAGADYWCEAKLELGPEGPQPPVVRMSPKLFATFYCKENDPTTLLPTTVSTITPTMSTIPTTTTAAMTTTPTTTTTTPTTTTTTTIRPKTTTDPNSSTGYISLHRCIMCFMLLLYCVV